MSLNKNKVTFILLGKILNKMIKKEILIGALFCFAMNNLNATRAQLA